MDRTRKALAREFAAQSVLAEQCRMYALKADRDGDARARRMFAALSRALGVHARRSLLLLRGGLGDGADNLEAALGEVSSMSRERYPELLALAAQDNDGPVAAVYGHFAKVARNHRNALESGGGDKLSVCAICGFIARSEPPERCPVCSAVKAKFEVVE